MSDTPLMIHGSIFFLLRKFIIHTYSAEVWTQCKESAGIGEQEFDLTQSYPLAHLDAIVAEGSKIANLSVHEMKEKFGEYLVPDLFTLYKNYLNPSWKTFEVLENTETVMHGAVRRLNSTATPPVLNVTRINDKLLFIDYFSERKMGGLAIGIVKGIAMYFNESDRVTVKAMSAADDARVQIRVEFK